MPIKIGVSRVKVKPVPDETYPKVLHNLITNAKKRCLCNVFIVDTSPALDRNLIVYSILLDLTLAAWRGVDTRLIIGGSRSNYDIALSAELARSLARVLDIPVRWMTSQKQQGSHAKLVIVDDLILIGSHNWSSGAYGPQTQDSILIQSKAAASYFKSRFELEWQRSGGSNEYI